MRKAPGWKSFAACAVCVLGSWPAYAQNYPARPVRIVVGFQAGGAVDIAARTVGQKLSDALSQSIVIDNRPGASGNIAAEIVAKSPPDGYVLLMSNTTIAMPSLFAKLPFDIRRDLLPISLVAIGPSLLATHPSLPVKSVKDLIALAKARPKELTYGSGGPGTSLIWRWSSSTRCRRRKWCMCRTRAERLRWSVS